MAGGAASVLYKVGTRGFLLVPAFALVGAVAFKEKNRPDLPEGVAYYGDGNNNNNNNGTCVLTGATSGIGLATAMQLSQRRSFRTLVVGSRDAARGAAAARSIRGADDACRVEVLPLDLTDSASVDDFVDELERRHGGVDLLVHAAAELHHEPTTDGGLDVDFATNQVGPQRLLSRLGPALHRATGVEHGRARVVVLGSRLERRGHVDPDVVRESRGQRLHHGDTTAPFDPLTHYADTKLANQLLVKELSRRWAGEVDVVSVSPGMVHTSLWRHFPLWYRTVTYPLRVLGLRDPEDAARGVVFAAIANGVQNGSYLYDGRPINPSEKAQDAELAKRLFEVCEGLFN